MSESDFPSNGQRRERLLFGQFGLTEVERSTCADVRQSLPQIEKGRPSWSEKWNWTIDDWRLTIDDWRLMIVGRAKVDWRPRTCDLADWVNPSFCIGSVTSIIEDVELCESVERANTTEVVLSLRNTVDFEQLKLNCHFRWTAPLRRLSDCW
jgi:hypothetical protein